MKGKKTKIISLMLTIVMCASILPMTIVNAAVEPVFSDDFNAATTTWYKDPLLATEDDGTGNMLTIAEVSGDKCAQKGITALTTGVYDFSFEIKPAATQTSALRLMHGTSGYQAVLAMVPDGSGKLTLVTGRETAVANTSKVATGLAANVWYEVKITVDIGNKKVTSFYVKNKATGTEYSRASYNFDTFATTWKTCTQIDRLGFYMYNGTAGDKSYIDNFVIQEQKTTFTLADSNFSISDANGLVSANWSAVAKESNQISINFGKAMLETDLTSANIFIENTTTSSSVAYTPSYENQIFNMTLGSALIPENTYKVTVKAGIEAADGSILDSDKVITFTVAEEAEVVDPSIVFSDDFNAATTLWYKDPLLVPEEDGTGNMMTIEGETTDKCSMKGIDALTTGLYEFSFEFKPASNTKSWFNIFNGSSFYHTIIATIPDDEGTLTFLTGRYADTADERTIIATGLAKNEWYNVKAVIDAGNKSVVAVEVVDESGEVYTHGAYNFDSYATTWKTGTQIDRIAIYTGTQSTTDRPYIDNMVIKEFRHSIELDDYNFTIYDENGVAQEDWADVSADTKTIEIDFGKDMVESALTASTIVVKDAEDNVIAYTPGYEDQVYTITFDDALTADMTYTVTVNAGLLSEDGYVVNPATSIEFTVAGEGGSEEEEDDEDVVFGDDFNTAPTTWGKDPLLVTEDDGTGNMLTVARSNGDNCAQADISPALTTGVYEISYAVKPSATEISSIRLIDSAVGYQALIAMCPEGGGTFTLVTGRESSVANTSKIASGLPTGEWYDVNAVVDMGKKQVVSVKVTNRTSGTEYTRTQGSYAFDTFATTWKTGTKIDKIGFYMYSGDGTNKAYLDNLKIKAYYKTPELGADSVKLYAGETLQADYQNVNPLLNRITLDFGTIMDESTLNNTNIKILDKDSNNVPVSFTFADTVCTITLPQGVEPNGEYTLSVAKAVANKKGTQLLNPYSLTFKTTETILKAPITGFKVSGTEVTALSQLAKDNELVIEFDYENSTNEPVELYVIVAYFSGNEMKSVSFIPKEFAADVLMGAQTATHTVKDLTGIDLIRVMVWDGLDTLHPLSPSVDIDNIQ